MAPLRYVPGPHSRKSPTAVQAPGVAARIAPAPPGHDGRAMTSLLPAPRRTRPTGEARADAAHRRPLVLLGGAGRRGRRGVHAAGLSGRRRRRLVPHRRRRPRRPARRPAGRRAGLADGPRLGRPRRRHPRHGGAARADPPRRRRRLAARACGWATPSPGTGRTPTRSPTASATGRSPRPPALFTAGYVAVAVVTHHLAATPATAPSLVRAAALDRPAVRPRRRYGGRDRLRTSGDLDVVPAARRCAPPRPPPGARSCGSSCLSAVVFVVALAGRTGTARPT